MVESERGGKTREFSTHCEKKSTMIAPDLGT